MYGSLALRSNQASKLVTKHLNELNPEGLSGKQLRFETFFSNRLFLKSKEDRLFCFIDTILAHL